MRFIKIKSDFVSGWYPGDTIDLYLKYLDFTELDEVGQLITDCDQILYDACSIV